MAAVKVSAVGGSVNYFPSSKSTITAALVMTIASSPASLGISNPPDTTLQLPVPWGRVATTAAVSTWLGWGDPMVTSTCMSSAVDQIRR